MEKLSKRIAPRVDEFGDYHSPNIAFTLGPVPIFPSTAGNFGTESSPFSSVVTTTSGVSKTTVLPVGWVQGLNGAHSTLQVQTGTTISSTSGLSTLAAASAAWGPIFSDGVNFSIVNDTTGSASNYWGLRGGNFG